MLIVKQLITLVTDVVLLIKYISLLVTFYYYYYYYRELHEECGLVANELCKVGVITFQFIDTPPLLDVHVFTTSNYTGTPVETEGINIVRGQIHSCMYTVYWHTIGD